MNRCLIIILLFLWLPIGVVAKPKTDSLTVAALLIKEGDFERAQQTLELVDLKNKRLDKKRYYTLLGVVLLKTGQYEKAKTNLKQAIQLGQKHNSIFVYLAQTLFALKEYQNVLKTLESSKEAAKNPSITLLKSMALWHLDRREQAWDILKSGLVTFPNNADLIRRQIFYLIDLKLYQEASTLGFDFVRNYSPTEKDYLAISVSLLRNQQAEEAIKFLEPASFLFPKNKQISLSLAKAYYKTKRFYSAARVLEKASTKNVELLSESAELYRRAKNYDKALFLNSLIPQQEKKLKQRMALLLEAKHFELIAGMEDSLIRNKLVENDNIRYALAYSFFKINNYSKAKPYLQEIRSPKLFTKATQILKMIDTCQKDRLECL